MTKLCARGKSAAKRKFKVYLLHMLMHMPLKYVQEKQKIHLDLKEKIGDQRKLMRELW